MGSRRGLQQQRKNEAAKRNTGAAAVIVVDPSVRFAYSRAGVKVVADVLRDHHNFAPSRISSDNDDDVLSVKQQQQQQQQQQEEEEEQHQQEQEFQVQEGGGQKALKWTCLFFFDCTSPPPPPPFPPPYHADLSPEVLLDYDPSASEATMAAAGNNGEGQTSSAKWEMVYGEVVQALREHDRFVNNNNEEGLLGRAVVWLLQQQQQHRLVLGLIGRGGYGSVISNRDNDLRQQTSSLRLPASPSPSSSSPSPSSASSSSSTPLFFSLPKPWPPESPQKVVECERMSHVGCTQVPLETYLQPLKVGCYMHTRN
jgi:hypothetical protein